MFARPFSIAGRQAVRSHRTRYFHLSRSVMSGSAVPARDAATDGNKRKHPGGYRFKSKKAKKAASADLKDGSHDSVLLLDVQDMLKMLSVREEHDGKPEDAPSPPARDDEVDVEVLELSSTGDGLAYHQPSGCVMVVPYTAPGDKVRARVNRVGGANHFFADLIEVVEPSDLRDDKLVRCPYFAKCSGCQFQMLPYEAQLLHKKRIVEKAYRNFSDLDADQIPAVEDTIGSPLQYGYRTKLTPHFEGPPGKRSDRRNGIHHAFTEVPAIGFMPKGSRKTLDIEDCPIATDAVRKGNRRERQRVADELHTFKRGATLLLRESTRRIPRPSEADAGGVEQHHEAGAEADAVVEQHPTHTDIKTCVTDPNAETTEYIEDSVFSNRAGAFFQNNNSILPPFIEYIRTRIRAAPTSADNPTAAAAAAAPPPSELKHLIDAYCGSGLFSILLAPLFTSTTGIDIATASIASATHNAQLNNTPAPRTSFTCADAAALFATARPPPHQTVVVIDPPRKGCDTPFLHQLAAFGPARVLYVSCNVHTQARDVGVLVRGPAPGAGPGARYALESLAGFDFFPQTGHVEAVAVLNRVVDRS